MPSLTCPVCGCVVTYKQLNEVPHRPFCGRRCQLIDLGRWLNEEYRISEECSPRSAELDLNDESAGDEGGGP